jgi:hypothetical protein
MKLLVVALVLGLLAASKAAAVEPAPPLQLKPKSALTSALVSPAPQHQNAPFIAPGEEPVLYLLPRDPRQDQSRSSCASDRDLCYDQTSGHIVYKPARQLMPEIPGLQRENISVKRDKVVLRYSF